MDVITEFRSKRRKLQGRTRRTAKGAPFRSITSESTVLGRHIFLHATKGWRNESMKRVHVRRELAMWRERIELAKKAAREALVELRPDRYAVAAAAGLLK